jgi:NADH dehydrogenase/NADH:ubiquinone oxidoreductase subunit G
MDVPDIFQPFDRLIEIEILGQKYEVPENNTLLRCFQYLAMENISFGDFCWNGECLNCQVWLKTADKDKAVMACRTIVTENMRIVMMAGGIDLGDV